MNKSVSRIFHIHGIVMINKVYNSAGSFDFIIYSQAEHQQHGVTKK